MADVDGGDLGEGHLSSLRRAYAHAAHVGDGPTFTLWVAEHHPNVVGAALETQSLVAVEALADLAGQVVEGQAQGASLWFELQLHLQLALLESVLNVTSARVFGDFAFEAVDSLEQLVEIG